MFLVIKVRQARWDGARNVADLGGLPLVGGGITAHHRVWRSAATEWMTDAGWTAVRDAGVSRVIDLRNDAECGRRPEHPPVKQSSVAVEVVRAPTEDPDDPEFLEECGPWLDHPRSWAPNLRRYPDKIARVFAGVADAGGPVLIHCAGGRDRTGMICSMLLALNGVEPDAICANYDDGFRGAGEHRGHGLAYDPVTAQWSDNDARAWTRAELDEAMSDRLPVLAQWLQQTDVETYLREAGLDPRAVDRLRGLLRD